MQDKRVFSTFSPAPIGCQAPVRGELAGFDNFIIRTLRAAVRHPAPVGHAGFDDIIIRTLRAAVWHPAPNGCQAPVRGELAGFDDFIIRTLRAAAWNPAPIGSDRVSGGGTLGAR